MILTSNHSKAHLYIQPLKQGTVKEMSNFNKDHKSEYFKQNLLLKA